MKTSRGLLIVKRQRDVDSGQIASYNLAMHLRNNVKPWKRIEVRRMREHPTVGEDLLWRELYLRKLGVKFRCQVILRGWIVDFYCPQLHLVVEVDGASHAGNEHRDRYRNKALGELGFRTLRIPDSLVRNDMPSAIRLIKECIG